MNNLDFLIYSSHKTSTQSLLKILHNNNYKAQHIHILNHMKLLSPKYNNITNLDELKKLFLLDVYSYVANNNKKLSIISIVRNPHRRLLSSFFQSYHCDQITYLNTPPSETSVSKLNLQELFDLYYSNILLNKLPGIVESIDQLSYVFDTDIIKNLEDKVNYHYYENDFIKLYVLNFDKVIARNNVEYLNNVIQLNLTINGSANLSEEKEYYEKYNKLKEFVSYNNNINNMIDYKFNKFYFT